MGVLDVVAALADSVAATYGPLNPRHTLMVRVLRWGREYAEAGRLDAWESAFQDVEGEVESSPIGELLGDIFELGRYNLYTLFDPQGTRAAYQQLAEKFQRAQIPTPPSPDLSDW